MPRLATPALLALLAALLAPLAAGAQAAPEADRLAAIRTLVERRAAADSFSGVAIVARGGQPILSIAAGLADERAGTPVTLDTRFTLASLTKMFTAVAVAQLVEQGRLALADPIAKHLPDWPNADVARQVTIEHLLTHTSGLGSYWGPAFEARRDSLRTLADYVPLFAGQPLQFAPGERYAYSNAGFIVLGRIVEVVSGTSYHDYVQRHVFDPAGMRNTGFFDGTGTADVACSYTRQGASPGARRDVSDQREARGSSAGGGYSTAGDLLAFGRALTDGRLMRPETLRRFTTGRVDGPMGPKGVGYGFVVGFGGVPVVGHLGGSPGASHEFFLFPQQDLAVVLLTNRDVPETMPVAMRLRGFAMGR